MHTAPFSPAPGSSAAPAPNFRVNKPPVKGPTRAAQPTGDTGGWKERRTVDGGEYYHNVLTDEARVHAHAHAMHTCRVRMPRFATYVPYSDTRSHAMPTMHAALPPI